ncbi:hypothetical protein ACPDHJ_05665 [Myroides sp. C8-3]|nr:hypothetical protein [Myroides sp. NP-2]
MKLQTLQSFDVLNKDLVNTIIGGNASFQYDCSKKFDVDSNSRDYQQ